MTRRHFRAIAEELKGLLEGTDTLAERAVAISAIKRMATVCKGENPRFDYGTFYRACGLEELD